MDEIINGVPSMFPLTTIGNVLEAIHFDESPLEAECPWTQQWGVYTTPRGRGSRLGMLRIRRVASGDDGIEGPRLEVAYEKSHAQGRQHVRGRFDLAPPGAADVASERLSTPRRWQFEAHVTDGSGEVIPETCIEKRFRAKNGYVTATCRVGGGREVAARPAARPIPAAYTLHWALFDAVPRLSGADFQPQRFTLIDHFDQFKPGHVLSYRGRVAVPVGGRQVEMTAYDHTGRGVIPTVWWVDQTGHLAVVVSGMEVYAREAAREEAAFRDSA